MKTILLKTAELTPNWWVIDGTDKVVGRLAAKIAPMLLGKHRPDFTPHQPSGDFIIVTNVDKLKFTGRKWANKEYNRYSGYPSGRTVLTAEQLRARNPEWILKLAVRRMLPKNPMGYKLLTRLKMYVGPEHPHQCQQPKVLDPAL